MHPKKFFVIVSRVLICLVFVFGCLLLWFGQYVAFVSVSVVAWYLFLLMSVADDCIGRGVLQPKPKKRRRFRFGYDYVYILNECESG